MTEHQPFDAQRVMAAIILARGQAHANPQDEEWRAMISRAIAEVVIRIWLRTRPWVRPPWQKGRRKSAQPLRDICRWDDRKFWTERTATLVLPRIAERRSRDKSVLRQLASIVKLDAAGLSKKAMLEVLRFVDEALSKYNYPRCDLLLKRADASMLSADTLVTLLSCTHECRVWLPSRKRFAEQAHAKLSVELGPEDADVLKSKIF